MHKTLLHIGVPKTASTFLQNWMRENSYYLKTEGISVMPAFLAHRMAAELLKGSRLESRVDVAAFLSTPMSPVLEFLAAFKRDQATHRLLISSEYFYLCAPNAIAIFLEAHNCQVIRVICYIRRQDRLIATGLSQDIKMLGRIDLPAIHLQQSAYSQIYDWNLLVLRLQEFFPNAVIALRNFDVLRLRNFVLQAFLSELGIEKSSDTARTRRGSLCQRKPFSRIAGFDP